MFGLLLASIVVKVTLLSICIRYLSIRHNQKSDQDKPIPTKGLIIQTATEITKLNRKH